MRIEARRVSYNKVKTKKKTSDEMTEVKVEISRNLSQHINKEKLSEDWGKKGE